MEARVGKLLQHEVGDVRTIDTGRARGKRVGQDAVGAGKGAIHEPGSAHNSVVDLAGREQTFLGRLIDKGVLQDRILCYPQCHGGQGILIFAIIRVDPRRAQHDEPVDVLLPHTLKDVGDGAGKHLGFFPGAGSQRGEYRAVAPDGVSPSGLRTKAVTACPLASAWVTISLPVRPVAPKTMIFI